MFQWVTRNDAFCLQETGFTREQLQLLCRRVCPIIRDNRQLGNHGAKRLRRDGRAHYGRPTGAFAEDRLIWYLRALRCQTTNLSLAFTVNRARSAIQRDFWFITWCVNTALHDIIRWPTPAERRVLADMIATADPLYGAIGIIDGTLQRIHRVESEGHGARVAGGRDIYYNPRR
jgi:hypothetical protein